MQSKANTVKEYLASLPTDRRTAIEAVRKVILANLDKDYEEGMQYGMIGYYVPHSVYPPGYHCNPKQPVPFVSLASQKNHMALYLGIPYCGCAGGEVTSDGQWFRENWAKAGKKLDMGRACLRFNTLDDLALDVIGKAVKRIPAKRCILTYVAELEAAGIKHDRGKPADAKQPVVTKAKARKPSRG